jgi:hypothetical protein
MMTSQVIASSSPSADDPASPPSVRAMPRILLAGVLCAFGILTVAALARHGYWGILAPHFQSLAGLQVFVDLVIALVLVMVWMWHDARRIGRNPWPWIVATLLLGSFGPLVYLLTRKAPAEASVAPPLP